MKTVWIVERGDYDDHCVIGVYSSEEIANYVCDTLNRDNFDKAYYFEEMIDAGVVEHQSGLNFWHVEVHPNGSITAERKPRQFVRGEFSRDIWETVHAHIWAASEAEAIRMAQAKRAEWIATGKWDGA